MVDAPIALISGRALRHDIADALRDEIIHGRLEPGERVLEVDLARRFGVSRQPVREAIRTLEREGLLTSLANRGTFVTRVSLEDAIVIQATAPDSRAGGAPGGGASDRGRLQARA